MHILDLMMGKPSGSSTESKSLSPQINNSQAVYWADSYRLVHYLRSYSHPHDHASSKGSQYCDWQWQPMISSLSQVTLGFRVFQESCQSVVSEHFLSSRTAYMQKLKAVHCSHELPGHTLYGQCMTCQVNTPITRDTWHLTHEADTRESPLQAGKMTQEWILHFTSSPECKTSQSLKVTKRDLCVKIVREGVATHMKCDEACGELCTS